MSLGSKIKGFFVTIWHLLRPIEQDALQKIEEKLTPEILDAVRNGLAIAAAEGLHDTDARDKAIAAAKQDLVQAGHDVVDIAKSEWNLAVEILYNAGQKELTEVGAKVSTTAEQHAADVKS